VKVLLAALMVVFARRVKRPRGNWFPFYEAFSVSRADMG
jgi:hypothetical protein